jgi:uncharacterized membrane protein YeaQ/YmgE (transglycosylase-associated protein family)
VNKTGEGLILDIILGIVGAVLGGYLFNWFGAQGVTGLNLWSLLVAVIGAIVVLVIYRLIIGVGVWLRLLRASECIGEKLLYGPVEPASSGEMTLGRRMPRFQCFEPRQVMTSSSGTQTTKLI